MSGSLLPLPQPCFPLSLCSSGVKPELSISSVPSRTTLSTQHSTGRGTGKSKMPLCQVTKAKKEQIPTEQDTQNNASLMIHAMKGWRQRGKEEDRLASVSNLPREVNNPLCKCLSVSDIQNDTCQILFSLSLPLAHSLCHPRSPRSHSESSLEMAGSRTGRTP